MAEAALQEEFTFPEGGIGDFYMEDDEIEALGRLEAEEAYGSSGIANFSDVAERMASYGRHGDDTVAHVETGELVIPKALIEDNPKLRDSIFNHLEELGVENPERYVVGSGANSINPDTGLPEFFFRSIARALKKTVKKVTGAVKKVAKKVVKVVKKVAPIILPIALAMTPLGPIYGAALGSGIGTLAQGGSLQDAFKSALIAGGTGALFSGASSKLSGGTFTEGVTKAAANPAGRLAQTVSGAKSTFTGQGLTGEGNLFSSYTPTASEQLTEATQAGIETVSGDQTIQDMTTSDAYRAAQAQNLPMDEAGNYLMDGEIITRDTTFADLANKTGGGSQPSLVDTVKEYGETAGDYLFRGGESKADVLKAQELAGQNYLTDMKAAGITPTQAGLEAAKAAAGPGFITKFGPSAALAGTAAYGLGAFTAPEQEDLGVEDVYTPIRTGPEYELPSETPTGATGPTVVDTRYGFDPRSYLPFNPFQRPVRTQRVAEGGEIFPRRVGGIMPDEGVPGKDSVRAMLMPGEFVMTTDAVKGLGNGDNDQGIKNMYDMMRGLEAKGRSMA